MTLSKNQFDLLVLLTTNEKEKLTQRNVSKALDLSLGTVNSLYDDLKDYITDGHINASGKNLLEKYRVKNALFICAGFGSRMVPITLETPKPLVEVRGKRIIDILLEACVKAEIENIVIVRGYLGEKFDVLLEKYPNIKFIDNPLYNESNNISSALVAKNHFSNSYVLEGDIVLHKPELITKYQYSSNYLGVKVDLTDDWCFKTNKGIIEEVMIGGKDCHQMYGISYWTEEDGKKLKTDLEKSFYSPGGREKFWDEVPLTMCKDNYKVSVRECQKSDIIELDTYAELMAYNKGYNK